MSHTFLKKSLLTKQTYLISQKLQTNSISFLHKHRNRTSKIPTAKTTIETYVETVNSTMEPNPFSINELNDAFFSLKINKRPGNDEISFNVVKKCFGELYDPLKFIFELSLEKGIFPDDLKIARLTPVLKVVTPLNWENINQYQSSHVFQNQNMLAYYV